MSAKMHLLWNATTRTYQGIHEMNGMWFVQVDLGPDTETAKNYVRSYNND